VAEQRIITFTTDFGLTEHYVGTMKGVILNINPSVHLVDISNLVQSYDVLDGALAISQSYSYFPTGTVHVVVVDPGVGTTRRPIIASSDGYHFVAPDNGVLSMVYAREERIAVRHITADHYFRQPVSNTFHGRDVFAPVAAYLAKHVDSHKFGDPIQDYVRFAAPRPKPTGENRIRAVVLKVDRFGNLITNVTPEDIPSLFGSKATKFKITVGNKEITEIHANYAEGTPGEVFGILGSMGYLEIAANRASASQLTSANKGSEVNIVLGDAAAAGNGA